jgi:hypothetical protein
MALSQLPVSVMEATLFSCIIYPMVGFHASSAYFMVFWAVVTACNLCLSALFRWVARGQNSIQNVGMCTLCVLVSVTAAQKW